jgi:hypothetical protein
MQDILPIRPATITFTKGDARETLTLEADGTVWCEGRVLARVVVDGFVVDTAGARLARVDARGIVYDGDKAEGSFELANDGAVFVIGHRDVPLIGYFEDGRMWGLALGPADDDSLGRCDYAGPADGRRAASMAALAWWELCGGITRLF